MKFYCPQCDVKYRIAEEKLKAKPNAKLRCKQCSRVFSVRAAIEAAKARPPRPSDLPPPKQDAGNRGPSPRANQAKRRTAPREARAQKAKKPETQGSPVRKPAPARPRASKPVPPAPSPRHSTIPRTRPSPPGVTPKADAAIAKGPSAGSAATVEPPALAEWFVEIDGAPVGPLSEAELMQRTSTGELTASTLVWRDGMADWQAASGIDALRPLLGQLLAVADAKPAAAKLPSFELPSDDAAPGALGLSSPQKPSAEHGQGVSGDGLSDKPTDVSSAASIGKERTDDAPAPLNSSQEQKSATADSIATDEVAVVPAGEGRDDVAGVGSTQAKSKPALDAAVTSSTALGAPKAVAVAESMAPLEHRKMVPASLAWVAGLVALLLGFGIGYLVFYQPAEQTLLANSAAQAAADPDGVDNPGLPPSLENAPPPPPELPTEVQGNAKLDTTVASTSKAVGRRSTRSATSSSSTAAEGAKSTGLLAGSGGPVLPRGPSTGPRRASSSGSGTGLDASSIQATVQRYRSGVRRSCWNRALQGRSLSAPNSARVTVSLSITPDGKVSRADTSGDPSGYPGLSRCIQARVRSWRFPASSGSTAANIPFVFAVQ